MLVNGAPSILSVCRSRKAHHVRTLSIAGRCKYKPQIPAKFSIEKTLEVRSNVDRGKTPYKHLKQVIILGIRH